jgi:uncharacterized damage-inducible protein DinB
MSKTDDGLLEALLDSWNRGTNILLNLLHALPDGGLEAKEMDGSPSVAVMFSHIHETRLFWLSNKPPSSPRGRAIDLRARFFEM